MKKLFQNKKFLGIIRVTSCIVFVLLAIFLFCDMNHISIKSFLSSSPKYPIFAALIVLLLYAIKSITVVFPLAVLQLIAGSMFEPFPALLLNFSGIIICYTIPYYIGNKTRLGEENKILAKYPKLEKLINHEQTAVFFPSVLLRLIGFLPTDLVSLYLGTFSNSYPKYITGSLLGSAIRTIAITILGSNLDNIRSPQFIVSVIIIVLLTVLSCFGYVFYQRKKED